MSNGNGYRLQQWLVAVLLLVAWVPIPVWAQSAIELSKPERDTVPDVNVEGAYVRELPPGVRVTAAFLTLHNNGGSARTLVGVSSSLAERAEIHSHNLKGGKMMMRPVSQVVVAAHSEFEFKPGGYHIMLFGLKRELKVGDTLPLVLRFAGGGALSLVAQVVSP